MHPDWQNDASNYCGKHSTPEPDYLAETVRFTWLNTVNPRQLSGHLQGRFLSFMASLSHQGCILEIGTFTGYSALCLAEGAAKQQALAACNGEPVADETQAAAEESTDVAEESAP